MATKNVAEVVIAGKILKITGYESMEYLHQIASYINDKIGEFEQLESYRRQPADQKQILLYMNLADDFFKSKRQADQQKMELEKKDKEMYSLKHDLIESQMTRENQEKTLREQAGRLEELNQQLEEVRRQLESLQEEKQLLERQSEEKQSGEKQPAEKQPAEKQPADQPEQENRGRNSRNAGSRKGGASAVRRTGQGGTSN